MSLNSHATVTAVASLDTSATMLAANEARRAVSFVNTDANVVYIKFGATATATSFTIRLAQNESYHSLWGYGTPPYTGIIDAIWATNGTGHLIITER